MPYTAQFFAEKLNVPVEYLNPLRNVQIDPGVNLEELARVAHSMGEVVGLGLRNLANCPVELNLMPESTLRWQSFNQKKPYLFGAVISLVLVVFAAGWLFTKLADYKQSENEDLKTKVQPLQAREQQFIRAFGQLKNATNDLAQLSQWIQDRYLWADTLAELRRVLTRVEAGTRQRLGADTGVWIERLTSLESLGGLVEPMAGGMFLPAGLGRPGMSQEMIDELRFGGDAPAPAPPPPEVGPDGMPVDPNAAGEAASKAAPKVTLICRGVDMSRVDSSANAAIAYALEAELRQSAFFTTNTVLASPITDDPATSTFSFTILLEMNRPLKQ
jgi:Tfp pilus assembly protein PilN